MPRGWERDPKSIHEKLMEAGALELGADAIGTFRDIKMGWDSAPTAAA